jgi:translation initiation factor IF-1
MNGKGSKPRPLSVPVEVYNDNYDNIFRKQTKKYRVNVQKYDNGDMFIEIPDKVLKAVNIKEGDMVKMEPEGLEYKLTKVNSYDTN